MDPDPDPGGSKTCGSGGSGFGSGSATLGSRVKKMPDPLSGSASKNFARGKMPGSFLIRIQIQIFSSRIRGLKKHRIPDPQYWLFLTYWSLISFCQKYVALHKQLAITSDDNALHKMIMESYRSLCFIRQGIVCYTSEISVCWIYIYNLEHS